MWLLLSCALIDLIEVASKVDREHCTFSVDIDPGTCTCLEGAAWEAFDAAGDRFASTDGKGVEGVQPVGTTQAHAVEPGTVSIAVTFVYLDGQTSENAGEVGCPAGGYGNQHLVCDCKGWDTGAETGSDTGG